MRWISVLGLISLLGIAWLMSYDRWAVRWRTIAWGIGLQILFAVIVLSRDVLSFTGMAALGGLLVVYLVHDGQASGAWARGVAAAAVAAVAGTAVVTLAPESIGALLVAVLAGLLVNARWRPHPAAGRWLGIALVTLGIGWMIANGVTGRTFFAAFSDKVAYFLGLSDFGARFLFGNLADPAHYFPGAAAGWPGFGFQFAFKVLPTIIFFGGFMGVLYYLGIMQRVIQAMARFMRWTIGTSGAETLSCSANVFVGQTEAPLLIKPFLEDMTPSELLTVMVGGFATIAGGVLAGYIAMGIPAGHLIAASVMAAPASLVVGKLLFPEDRQSSTAGDVTMPEIDSGDNVIGAAANGISDGFHLALNVGAMLIGFIALIAVVDVILNQADAVIDGGLVVWLDGLLDGRLAALRTGLGTRVEYGSGGMSPANAEIVGFFPGSLQTLFGTVLRPLAWLMGVPWADAGRVGNLFGIKLSLNEFVAYGQLSSYIKDGLLSERAVVISTYALCGFANFSSIGIQIGGISAIAPSRKGDLARLGFKAMLGGAIVSWLSATIAGMLI